MELTADNLSGLPTGKGFWVSGAAELVFWFEELSPPLQALSLLVKSQQQHVFCWGLKAKVQ